MSRKLGFERLTFCFASVTVLRRACSSASFWARAACCRFCLGFAVPDRFFLLPQCRQVRFGAGNLVRNGCEGLG